MKTAGVALSKNTVTPPAHPCLRHPRRASYESVKYLARYLKRPPVAPSQLRHYRGGAVVHQYYDHNTQQHKRQKLTQEEMLLRYISHIPAQHFKMVRYYGFLANRKRDVLLPKGYEAWAMTVREKTQRPGFAVLMKGFWAQTRTNAFCVATELLSEKLHWMEKNDGCKQGRWISVPEKWV
ncbi:Putative transposase [Yersinia mollaretii]|uniref:Transposase n=1 Tax=Yersinia mollaretii TaxID=33060 RepID=A0AA36LKB9_YERMO|nr:transposase [Yersinia mollaretii]CNH65384.1 Putative transposase [Yersinia mollaretii]